MFETGEKMKDVAVIGGGAAGMFFAVSLMHMVPNAGIVIYEAKERVGKKLAVTGNGRCNISNISACASNYHGDAALAGKVLQHFGFEEQRSFFKALGVHFALENDRAYPRSFQAASVVDALRFAAVESGVEIRCNCAVLSVKRDKGMFECVTGQKSEKYRSVAVACGGKAGGKLGSSSGYDILKALGHKIEPVFPSVVQLKTETDIVRQLKGIKVDAAVTIRSSLGERSGFGEVLFCDYGLSGPAILQVSRLANGTDATISLDIMPDFSKEKLTEALCTYVNNHPSRPASELFTGLLNKRLGQVITKTCGVALDRALETVEFRNISKIVDTVKDFRIKVLGTTGFENAQVTTGGANTAQFFETLMSKKARGLFAMGEVLNVDGDCGGYNLAFAWASAHVAALAAAEYLSDNK